MGEVMDNACVLQASGLRKEFFRKGRESARYFDAVASVDLALCAGEVVALMGRSGSGKTTLLNMMAGLLSPTEGTVQLEGRDLYALGDSELSRLRNERVGVVPQGQSALHSLSVVQNVMLPRLMYRADDGEEGRALALLDQLGIGALADAFPRELSGGELRRVAIARALVNAPAAVLADEPTADLDDENTEVVLCALRQAADAGAAVLVVTHDRSAASHADRTLRLDAGKLA